MGARTVSGADVAYAPGDRRLCAAVAVLGFPALAVLESATACGPVPAPYRSGSLGPREAPAILAALARLGSPPDALLVEGHGRAHPARFGSACAVGRGADLPTVGAAKARLVGSHGPVPPARGAWVPLEDGGEVVGAVVRTRTGVKPVYVSVGHRVGLEQAVALVLACAPRYRLPEPLRQAHRLARAALEEERP